MAGPLDNPFAGYRFHRVLGRRTDAGVYEATEQATDRAVVIETLVGDGAENEDLREWFEWAWEEVRELERPGVVRVFDVGERDGVPFAVRESIAGEELSSLLDSQEAIEPDSAEVYFDQLAEALSALHEAGIVHGALAHDSVLIGRGAGDPEAAESVHLTGFGRVEGHRNDDVRALAGIHSALLEASGGEAGPVAVVHERAEAGGYRSVDELVAAIALARAGQAPEEVEEIEEEQDEDEETGGSPHRRARRGFALASVIAVVAVVAVAVITSGEKDDSTAVPATSGPADDPPPAPNVSATGEGTTPVDPPEPASDSVEPIDVPGQPAGISVRDGVVYTVTAKSGELLGYDERTGDEVVGPIDLGGDAGEITIVDEVAWVTLPADNQVAKVEISAGNDATAEPIVVGEGPTGVIGAPGSIFSADSGSGGLSQIDPASSSVTPLIIGAQEPRGIAFGADSLWVTDGAGFVLRVDPENPTASESFSAGAEPRGVLVIEDEVWVANSGDGTISSLGVESGEGDAIDVGGRPLDLASDGERIWVANGDGYASAIEIESGAVERVDIPDSYGAPVAVAVGDEVWVTTEGGSLFPLG